jgi:hypothetical protein
MTKIQRAKRKHGTTKDREEGEQYVLKKMTAENIHDTQIWEYTHATRKPGDIETGEESIKS